MWSAPGRRSGPASPPPRAARENASGRALTGPPTPSPTADATGPVAPAARARRGGILPGLGAFQLFDGVVDHKLLRLHQIGPTACAESRRPWLVAGGW
ncbi:DUF2243 domain-containing protein [Streptomyces sp. NPDC020707]|uniref:DUF2243 domain-containing protein n=1 Tax=Streptomyces sp. NPDC020707 TaxID=3365084 RepID=UPI0037BCE391